ncbi:MAG: hypothetical protein WCL23_02025 [Candidatus Moraniibacteriota bacterium]
MEEKDAMTIDDLARIVQNGFLKMDEQFSVLGADVAELKTDVAILKTDVAELKTDVAEIKTDVAILKTDVVELKDTVGNIEANLTKKVDKIEYNTLEYRVERLEEAPAV